MNKLFMWIGTNLIPSKLKNGWKKLLMMKTKTTLRMILMNPALKLLTTIKIRDRPKFFQKKFFFIHIPKKIYKNFWYLYFIDLKNLLLFWCVIVLWISHCHLIWAFWVKIIVQNFYSDAKKIEKSKLRKTFLSNCHGSLIEWSVQRTPDENKNR